MNMMKKNTNYEGSFNDEKKSASMAKAEREIKVLKEENSRLKIELKETSGILNQLLSESSHEKFDERRINLLKTQIIQLERQMLLLFDSIAGRSESLLEVENVLNGLADQLRSHIGVEVRGPTVLVERRELVQMVEATESARIKLFKKIENCSKQSLSKPLLFMDRFISPGRESEVTLLDVASGNLGHLNLKRVAQLESKLSVLYKELFKLHEVLTDSESSDQKLFSCHVTSVVRERLKTQMQKSCVLMKCCTDDLLTLSLLYPSAPWPVLKKTVSPEVTCDKFMSCLPSLPRNKTQEVHQCVQALLKAVNYRHHMMNKQVVALKEEIKFHQKIYNHHAEYMETILTALKDGYCGFEKSLCNVLVVPLKDVLEAYHNLEDTASQRALKEFLSVFKDNSQQFTEAVERLSTNGVNDSGENAEYALSTFGEDYLKSLEDIVQKQQLKRDCSLKEDPKIKSEQEKLNQELQTLLNEIEQKKNLNNRSPVKEDDQSVTSCLEDIQGKHEITIDTVTNMENDRLLASESNYSQETYSNVEEVDEALKMPKLELHPQTKLKLRKPESPKSYQPNLSVAKSTLKLIRPESQTEDQPFASISDRSYTTQKRRSSNLLQKKTPFK